MSKLSTYSLLFFAALFCSSAAIAKGTFRLLPDQNDRFHEQRQKTHSLIISYEQKYRLGLPKQFDGRVQWPGCIHGILDQGACGSCWAFAATEVMSDRFCIYSNGAVNVTLSPQDLLSCEDENLGCMMGSPADFAFLHMQNYGVMTLECVPYTSGDGDVPSCSDPYCSTNSQMGRAYFVNNYTHVGSFVEPSHHVEEIMAAVIQGPVDVTFDVWGDFMDYTGGVYQHQSGSYEGLHSVKVIGYGTENGVDYWLVQNSWGPTWGLNGYFKIRRGADECFIETMVYTGFPSL